MSNMFEESLSGNTSPEVMAVAKASIAALNGNQLSLVCKEYNVDEQDVVQFIVEKTEYETILDMERLNNISTPPTLPVPNCEDVVKVSVKGGQIWSKKK